MPEWIKKNGKLAAFAMIVLAILVLNQCFGWSEYLGDTANYAFLGDMIEDNIAAAGLIYIAVTVVACVVLALPGVTFAIIAGVMFGALRGTILCLVATTLGAIIAFIAGRFFLKDSIKPMLEKNRLLKKLLFDDSSRSDIVLLAITRLVPIFPYNIQNFAYGVTDISLAHYSLYTFLFMIPGVSLYTVGTAAIVSPENRAMYIIITAVLLAAVLAAGYVIKKKFLSKDELALAEEERSRDES